MSKDTKVYKFKKGQKIHLDEIYNIQGVANNWFEEDFSGKGASSRPGLTDYLIITKDIKITITVDTK